MRGRDRRVRVEDEQRIAGHQREDLIVEARGICVAAPTVTLRVTDAIRWRSALDAAGVEVREHVLIEAVADALHRLDGRARQVLIEVLDVEAAGAREQLDPRHRPGVRAAHCHAHGTSSATLEVEIGGTARGSGYDGLDVTGSFQAGGALVVKFVNGFAPKTGDKFELVRADQVSGAFANLSLQGLASGFSYRLALEDGKVTLVATSDGIALPVLPAVGVLGNDADPDHEVLSAILIEGPAKGTLQLFANGAFRYIAGPEFDGRDSFRYVASDGFLQSQPVSVSLTNLPPVARSDVYHAIEEEVFVSPFSVLANDTDDMPGTVLTARLIQFDSATGTLHFQSDGTFTFTPRLNFFGNTSFLYVASDGLTESELVVGESPVYVEIIVAGRNDPPPAVDDRFATRAGEPFSVVTHRELLHNDVDPDGDRLIVIDMGQPDPAKGAIEIHAALWVRSRCLRLHRRQVFRVRSPYRTRFETSRALSRPR